MLHGSSLRKPYAIGHVRCGLGYPISLNDEMACTPCLRYMESTEGGVASSTSEKVLYTRVSTCLTNEQMLVAHMSSASMTTVFGKDKLLDVFSLARRTPMHKVTNAIVRLRAAAVGSVSDGGSASDCGGSGSGGGSGGGGGGGGGGDHAGARVLKPVKRERNSVLAPAFRATSRSAAPHRHHGLVMSAARGSLSSLSGGSREFRESRES